MFPKCTNGIRKNFIPRIVAEIHEGIRTCLEDYLLSVRVKWTSCGSEESTEQDLRGEEEFPI
jgi:hypothetical protein